MLKKNKKKEETTETVKQQLTKIVKSQPRKVVPFVRWWVDTDAKNRTKENYDKDVKHLAETEFDVVLDKWLVKEEVQEAIKYYMKRKETIRMLNIYDSMYQKALDGDVKAAKWISDFFKSDFFKVVNKTEMQSEAEQYLKDIDIPLFDNN